MKLAYNEAGRRIGQGHPNARYTDREVELVQQLREQGFTFNQIQRAVGMPRSTIRDYCSGRCRCQSAAVIKEDKHD